MYELSDDEEDYNYNQIDKEKLFEQEYPQEEELDEEELQEEIEYKKMLYEKSLKKNNDYFVENVTEKKQINKVFVKKSLSLLDFNTKINKLEEESKPKKFVPKKIQEKRKTEPEIITKNNRKFNPRLIPYMSSDLFLNKKNYNKIIINDDNFPSL